MAASINKKKKSFTSEFIKTTAKYIGSGISDYFTEATPTAANIVTDAKTAASEVSAVFKETQASVFPKVRQIKQQGVMKTVMNWYMGASGEYGDWDDEISDSDLSFIEDVDNPNDNAEVVAQISETEMASNKVAKSVIDSSRNMLEGQIGLTANITTALDNQTSLIKSGFSNVDTKIGELIEVVTKNSAAMIEATVGTAATFAESKKAGHNDLVASGQFSLSKYITGVKENILNSPDIGMMSAVLPMAMNFFRDPGAGVSALLSGIVNNAAPNFQDGLKALDKEVNDMIFNALLRMGEGSGFLSNFGIKAYRNEFSGYSKSELELKSIPFDTTTKESIVETIPGYLRKIYEKISGNDVIYDYQHRRFIDSKDVKKNFHEMSITTNTLGNASDTVRSVFEDSSGYGSMIYDLMMTDLGTKKGYYNAKGELAQYRKLVEGFSDPKNFKAYAEELLANSGTAITDADRERLGAMSQQIASKASEGIGLDIVNQVNKVLANRNTRMNSYIEKANEYNMDLSGLSTSATEDKKAILEHYGRTVTPEVTSTAMSSTISTAEQDMDIDGTDYTNKALYEIFRLLDRGINVYKVGEGNVQAKPFKERGDNYLKAPTSYKPKVVNDIIGASGLSDISGPNPLSDMLSDSSEDSPNIMRDGVNEDGTQMSGVQKIGHYGKNLGRAIMSGDPGQIRAALGLLLRDTREVAQDKFGEKMRGINDKFGNITGSIKHKLTGAGYTYVNENGEHVVVDKNEKGGAFGFVKDYASMLFGDIKDKSRNWFSTVAGYFDYGDKGEKPTVKNKRKRLIGSSVGALAGAGLLGGPIGLVMGAVAGNALSSIDIGDKIKNLFFGKGDEKGKGKGIFTKLGDSIINPLRFQFEKTAHHLGDKLKKNILGPLSDIGFAIKERITSEAKSKFGKVFSAIGKVISAPFKAVGKIITAPFKAIFKGIPTLLGKTTRGTVTGVTGMAGAGLNMIANVIGSGKRTRTVIDPKTGEERVETFRIKDELKERRKKREEEINRGKNVYMYDENGDFIRDENGKKVKNQNRMFAKGNKAGYKEWLELQQKKRAERGLSWDNYTKSEEKVYNDEEWKSYQEEQAKLAEETAENTKNIAETTGKTEEFVSDLHYHSTHTDGEHSIFTHDHGIHDRLDAIKDVLLSIIADTEDEEVPFKSSNDEVEGQMTLDDTIGSGISQSPIVDALEDTQSTIEESSAKQSKEEFASMATNAAATVSAIGGLDNSDKLTQKHLIDEAAKDNSDADVIKSDLADLMTSQEDEDVEIEEEETIFDKIANFFGGGLGDVLKNVGLIAGGVALLSSILGNGNFNIGEIIKSIGEKVGNILDKFRWEHDEEDATERGINIVTETLADAGSDNWAQSILPGQDLYHVQEAANGDKIVNQNASNLKDEMLYWNPAKQNITGYTTSMVKSGNYELKADKYLNKATALTNERDALKVKLAEATDPKEIKKLEKQIKQTEKKLLKTEEARKAQLDKMSEADDAMDAYKQKIGSGTIDNTFKTVGNLGLIYGESALAGTGAKYLASAFGANDQQSEAIGNAATTISSSALTTHEMKAALTGNSTINTKITDKALSGVKKVGGWLDDAAGSLGEKAASVGSNLAGKAKMKLDNLGQSISKTPFGKKLSSIKKVNTTNATKWSDDAIKATDEILDIVADKLADTDLYKSHSSKIKTQFQKIITKIKGFFKNNKFLSKFAATCEKKAGEGAAKTVTGSLLTILAVGVFGLLGWADGIAGAAHLFMVRNVEVDDDMRNISATLKTILGAISGFGPGSIATIAIEALGIVMNAFSIDSLLTMIAIAIYKAVHTNGEQAIQIKQEKFNAELKKYNEQNEDTAELNRYEFNDLVNNADAMSLFGRGEILMDGAEYRYDESKQDFVRSGGFTGGGNQQYMRDEKGQILKDKDGHAVKLVDKYGNKIKYDTNLGDGLQAVLNDWGGFFGGRDIYETDETGAAKVNRDGSYVIKERQMGIGDTIADFFSGGAITQANKARKREQEMQERFSFMPTDKDEEEWYKAGADPTMLSAHDTLLTAPKSVQDTFNSTGTLESINKEAEDGINWAAKIAWASMNERVLWRLYEAQGLTSDQIEATIAKSRKTGKIDVPTIPQSTEETAALEEEVLQEDRESAAINKDIDTITNASGTANSILSMMSDDTYNEYFGGESSALSENSLTGDESAYASGAEYYGDTAIQEEAFGGDSLPTESELSIDNAPIVSAIDGTSTFLERILTKIGDIEQAIVDGITNTGNDLLQVVTNAFDPNSKDGIKTKDETLYAKLDTMIGALTTGYSNLISSGTGSFNNISRTYGTAITPDKYGTVSRMNPIQAGWNRITSFFTGGGDSIDDEPDTVDNIGGDSLPKSTSKIGSFLKKTAGKNSMRKKRKSGPKSFGGDNASEALTEQSWSENGSGYASTTEFYDNTAVQSEAASTNVAEDLPGAAISTEGGNPLNKEAKITLEYASNESPYSSASPHHGIDLVSTDGNSMGTVISSRFNGTVVGVKNNVQDTDKAVKGSNGWYYPGAAENKSGNMVSIQTDDGTIVRHMHLMKDSIPSDIKIGSKVQVGQPIGQLGTTGWSTGPHLHYEFEDGSNSTKHYDPSPSLAGRDSGTLPRYSIIPAGSTISGDLGNFKSVSTSDYEASMATAETTEAPEEKKEGLAGFIELLSDIGNEFLYLISGGLLGSKKEKKTSGGSGSSVSSDKYVSGGSYDAPKTSGSSASKQMSIEEFMKLVNQQIGKVTTDENGFCVYNADFYAPWISNYVNALMAVEAAIDKNNEVVAVANSKAGQLKTDKNGFHPVGLPSIDTGLGLRIIRMNDSMWHIMKNTDDNNPVLETREGDGYNIYALPQICTDAAYNAAYEAESLVTGVSSVAEESKTGVDDYKAAMAQLEAASRIVNANTNIDIHKNHAKWQIMFLYWCMKKGGFGDKMKFVTDDINAFRDYYIKQFPRSSFSGKLYKLIAGQNVNGSTVEAKRGDIMISKYYETVDQYHIGFIDEIIDDGKTARVICGGYRGPGDVNKLDTPAMVAKLRLPIHDKSTWILRFLDDVPDVPKATIVEKGDVEPVWAMLKEMGYTDEQTAGILGNIYRENGIRSRAMEMDFAKSFDPALYDKLTTDRAAIDDWVTRFVNEYNANGAANGAAGSYNLENWRGTDGHLYPGLGFVGFTGPNTQKYLEWLQNKMPGHTWDEAGAQLAYMNERIRNEGIYKGLRDKFAEDRDAAGMARAFYSRYEYLAGREDTSDANKGANYARDIYNEWQPKLSEKYPDVPDLLLKSDKEVEDEESKMSTFYGGTNASSAKRKPKKNAKKKSTARGGASIRSTGKAIGGDSIRSKRKSNSTSSIRVPMFNGGDSAIDEKMFTEEMDFGGDDIIDTESELRLPDISANIEESIGGDNATASIGSNNNYHIQTPTIDPLTSSSKTTLRTLDTSKVLDPISKVRMKDAAGTLIAPVTNNNTAITNSQATDLAPIISIMRNMLQALTDISNNGTTSNAYLEEINNKDFKDTELRNQFKALSKVKPKSYNAATSYTSAKAVTNLAKP